MRPGILSLTLLASCLTLAAADEAAAIKGKRRVAKRVMSKMSGFSPSSVVEAAQRTRMDYGAKLVHLAEDLAFRLDQLSVRFRGRPLGRPAGPGRPKGWLSHRLAPSGLWELWTGTVMGVADTVANIGSRAFPPKAR